MVSRNSVGLAIENAQGPDYFQLLKMLLIEASGAMGNAKTATSEDQIAAIGLLCR